MACGRRKKNDKGDPKPSKDFKKETVKSETETCMRCGGPLEREEDLLCRKCEGEVH
jgi:hypothetical protein